VSDGRRHFRRLGSASTDKGGEYDLLTLIGPKALRPERDDNLFVPCLPPPGSRVAHLLGRGGTRGGNREQYRNRSKKEPERASARLQTRGNGRPAGTRTAGFHGHLPAYVLKREAAIATFTHLLSNFPPCQGGSDSWPIPDSASSIDALMRLTNTGDDELVLYRMTMTLDSAVAALARAQFKADASSE
jgi:hypothetical protein